MHLCGVRNHIVCIWSYQFWPSDGRAFCLDLGSSSGLLCALSLGSSDTLALGNVVVFGVPLVLVVHLVVHLVVVHIVAIVVDHLVVHLVVVHLIVHLVVVHHVVHLVVIHYVVHLVVVLLVVHLVVVHHVVHLVVVHLVDHLVVVHLVVVVYNGACSFLGSLWLGWYSVSSAGSVYTDFIHILSLLLFQISTVIAPTPSPFLFAVGNRNDFFPPFVCPPLSLNSPLSPPPPLSSRVKSSW